MDLSYVIYMTVHGFCFGILLMIGLYLLTSKQSAYFCDIETNYTVRRNAGYNALLWACTFGITMFNMILRDKHFSFLLLGFDTMASMLVVPGIVSMLFCLLQLPHLIYRYFWLHILVPLCLIVWYLYDPQMLQVYISAGYWFAYSVAFAVWFVRKEKEYHRRLEDLYSNMEHHDIRWIYHFVWLFLIYFVLFLLGHVGDSRFVLYLSYFYCIGLWVRLAYRVDHYENVSLFWPAQSVSDAAIADPQALVLSPSDEEVPYLDANDDSQPLAWVGDRLREQCEETELYLRHDLSVDGLASHIGTNRTYISRYLASHGLTYFKYINTLRVNHAKRLIAENPVAMLSDIAFQSGFKSDSTFRRAFLECEKCTPSEFAKRQL